MTYDIMDTEAAAQTAVDYYNEVTPDQRGDNKAHYTCFCDETGETQFQVWHIR